MIAQIDNEGIDDKFGSMRFVTCVKKIPQCHSTRSYQEVQVAMTTNTSIFVILLFFCYFLANVEGNDSSTSITDSLQNVSTRVTGCKININGHLRKNSRLILHDAGLTDGYRFFLPTAGQSFLSFQHEQEVVFACPNGIYERARCQNGDTFQFPAPPRDIDMSQMTCRRPLRASVKNFGRCYNSDYNHLGIGITLRQDQENHEFIKLLDVCFNTQLRTTSYAKFTLMQGVESGQKNVKRPNFNCTPNFGYSTERSDEIYSRESQYVRLVHLLGSINQTDKFINRSIHSDLYLTRGHLVAYKDFTYYSTQLATMFCVNTAPMWQVIRKGNWRNLENSIRQYASREGKDLTIYSGTYGVLNLPHENGTNVPIYMSVDGNGKDVLPVPELFWKIVYDRLMRQGIVFIGVNNPNQNLDPVQYHVCTDVCDATGSWFNDWDRSNVSLGYVYCCAVQDFLIETNVIPDFRDIVVDILT